MKGPSSRFNFLAGSNQPQKIKTVNGYGDLGCLLFNAPGDFQSALAFPCDTSAYSWRLMGGQFSMTVKQIKIDADERIPTMDFEKLEPLQGTLKSLSDRNFEKLKKSILTEGFFVPVFIWHNGKRSRLLDGHQRLRVLTALQADGYTIPKIPYVTIRAKTESEAKRKLMLITSAYGKVERQGLYEFLDGFDPALLETDFALPEFELDPKKFMAEFYDDTAKDAAQGSTELSSERFETFHCKCPRCGFEFDTDRGGNKPE